MNSNVTTFLLIIFSFFISSISAENKLDAPTCQITAPSDGAEIDFGDFFRISVDASDDGNIDSVLFYVDTVLEYTDYTSPYEFTWNTVRNTIGDRMIRAVAVDDEQLSGSDTITVQVSLNSVKAYTYEVVNTYDHDDDAFTQGLAYEDDSLYEGTGLEWESTLRRVVLETGVVARKRDLPNRFFGEGIVIYEDKIIQLTYRRDTAFVYDKYTFNPLDTFEYSTYKGEGWGITYDGEKLIVSDGSSYLFFWDTLTYEEITRITVREDGDPVIRLNELEFFYNKVFANIWYKDDIVMIDVASGKVIGKIDCTDLCTAPNINVLNGIAYDKDNDRIFVTGKRWPSLYEINLVPKSITYSINLTIDGNGSTNPENNIHVTHNVESGDITANANEYYNFTNWTIESGDITITTGDVNSGTINITAISAGELKAHFEQITCDLTVQAGANGSVNPSGTQTVGAGDATAIEANPDEDYRFVDWTVESGSATFDDASDYTTNATLTSSDATIQANFEEGDYTVTFVEGANGSITGGTLVQEISHGGSSAAMTAEPDATYDFINWTGDYTGTENPLTVTNVTSDMTITANFALKIYTVTFVEGANGSITGGSLVQVISHGGSSAAMTAEPDATYDFVNWTGDHSGTENPLTVTNVTSDMTITANFALQTYTVTFVEGANGSITGGSLVQVISHGGSSAAMTAEPDATYDFVNWTGGYTGTENPLTITNVTSDMTITANFALQTYTVTFVEGANGSITGGSLVQEISHGGSSAEMTAEPDATYDFVNWTGGYTGTENPLTVTNVTSDMTITANFALKTYTVTFVEGSNGSIIGGSLVQSVPHGGSSAEMTATPDPNYHFTGWTGSHTGSENPLTVTNVTSEMTVTANFAIDQYTVTFKVSSTGGGTLSGVLIQTVDHGGDCSPVTAVPQTSYDFIGWTGDYTGIGNPLTITNIISDMTVTANFDIASSITSKVPFTNKTVFTIFPNPVDLNSGLLNFIFKNNRDVNAYLVIYDCVGNEIFKDNFYISANTNNDQVIFYTWNLTNNYGRKISSGAYLAVLKTSDLDNGNIEIFKKMIGVKDY